ncbi:acyl-CoA dehydrogenase family protein [Oceanobacillus saliphilus]|uniref:acyl-CoA dehydrogenase family protein n=1 Tax=Oceanobacillus saliphilus TaxID=2925834 RepID=UPI00201D3162|nr:acyl-CoA dehydrogenase family protein [Oceanobacillus saliphilus]
MTNFNFEYEFEEKLIRDTVSDAFNKVSSPEIVREKINHTAINQSVQEFLGEQGMIGILSPRDKGLDMNLQLTSIIVKEAGKRLVSFPVIEHLLGTYILKSDPTFQEDPYETGEKIVTLSWNHSIQLNESNNEITISGSVEDIPFLDSVDAVIIPLHHKALYIQKDLLLSNRMKLNGQDETYPLFKATLSNVPEDKGKVKLLSYDKDEFEKVSNLLITSEILGLSQEVLSMTLDYANERKQFGVPIGKFQAVKHMIADMHVYTESMDVSVRYGAWAIENDGEDKEIVATIAKAYTSDAIIQVIEKGIQVHGGVGLTWEHDLHLYLKRAYRLLSMNNSIYEEREKVVKHLSQFLLLEEKITN